MVNQEIVLDRDARCNNIDRKPIRMHFAFHADLIVAARAVRSSPLSWMQHTVYVLSKSPAHDHICLGTEAARGVGASRTPGGPKTECWRHSLTRIDYSADVTPRLGSTGYLVIIHDSDISSG